VLVVASGSVLAAARPRGDGPTSVIPVWRSGEHGPVGSPGSIRSAGLRTAAGPRFSTCV